jgi:hypothetical protein
MASVVKQDSVGMEKQRVSGERVRVALPSRSAMGAGRARVGWGQVVVAHAGQAAQRQHLLAL